MKSKQVQLAIDFATDAHRGQYRKGTKTPYIIHPIRVSELLTEHGFSESLIIAGVLHDTVEDTLTTLEDIENAFGQRISELVKGLSEPNKLEKWEERKQHTIDHMQTAELDVVIVACADKFDNVRSMRLDLESIGETLWSRFNRPRDKQKWYYEGLSKVFASRLKDSPAAKLLEFFEKEVETVFRKNN